MAIKIHFVGICTHVTERNESHRVVLVRADNGAYLNKKKIAPHIPKLRIDPNDITRIEGEGDGLEPTDVPGSWIIRGVAFELEGATDQSFARHSTFGDVPRLESPSRPGPASQVVDGEQAACYFDLRSGTMRAEQAVPSRAWQAVVDVETGPEPALKVTRFWDRKESRFFLKPNASITLEHTGYQRGDSDFDFLLHYRLLEDVPADAKVPKEEKAMMKKEPGDISIGCSNSQYP